ncbi:MAG: pyruvate kinase [Syntrophorhabdaceae bacterium]|nr:pyruvate kinase [Syntrophorhabdaceae bacterium]
MRKARIVCTLGPPTHSRKALEMLVAKGMDVARLNFSHGDHESHGSLIRKIRMVEKKLHRRVAILQDLQGIKIRVGSLSGGKVNLEKGRPLEIRTGNEKGDSRCVFIDYPWLVEDARPGDRILLDDGLIQLEVQKTSGEGLDTVVVEGGILKEHKGVNLPGMKVSAPFFTEKDRADIDFGITMGVDYVALSFVRSAGDVREVKTWLKARGVSIPLIAKIEKEEAIGDIDAILGEADGIMVARGDLGVEMPLEEVPMVQKLLIRSANEARKIVITATQMLESMTGHSRPTRAETTDVANAVLDGTDALMLSAETSAGKYPFDAVEVMDRIISFTEGRLTKAPKMPYVPPREDSSFEFAEAVAEAASRAAEEMGARCIVAFTMTGFTARLISKFRPTMPIIALSPDESVVRRMSLYRGVIPYEVRKLTNTDRMIETTDRFLVEKELAREGDVIVLVAGHPIATRSKTNFMKMHRVGKGE